MSRYIDADKLLNRFMDYICHDFACSDCKARYYPSGICRVDKMLREFPTADVVEVVRCKDCSNWDKHWISSLFSENVHYCTFIDGPCNGDFYCGAAVKRQTCGGAQNEV